MEDKKISKDTLNSSVQVKPIQDKYRLILVANVGCSDIPEHQTLEVVDGIYDRLNNMFDDSVKVIAVADKDSSKISFYCPNAVLGEDSEEVLNDIVNEIEKDKYEQCEENDCPSRPSC